MTPEVPYFLEWAITATFVLLIAAMAAAFLRLAIGPTLADRVVALDLMTILAVAFAGLFAIATDHQAYLDVAIALALVAFLATVAFARYAERRQLEDDSQSCAPSEVRDD